eukprot:GSChrysophyteH1.ASY1.ANO1.1040.1 assembled CDS
MQEVPAWKRYTEIFYRQFRALVWKNFKLKLRNRVVLILEIAVPALIIFSLGFIKNVIIPVEEDAISPYTLAPDTFVKSIPELYDLAYCGHTSLVWRCTSGRNRDDTCKGPPGSMTGDVANSVCTQEFIAVAPSDASDSAAQTAASGYVDWANQKYVYSSNGVNLEPTFVFFESEQKFEDALQKESQYSFSGKTYSSAVIFNGAAPDWEYTVRLNKTFNVGARLFDVATEVGAPIINNNVRSSEIYPDSRFGQITPYHKSWIQNGYATLTNSVNSYLATLLCRETNRCTSAESFDYSLDHANPFPSEAYTTTGFWGAVGDVFALLMIVVLLYPLANVISVLVREKESKLREGMKMMALKGEVLWMSWWVNFMCLFLPLSLILTWVATSFAIFISAFFTNSRTAAICGSLIFFGGYFIYVGIGTAGLPRSQLMAACLHPAAAFTYNTTMGVTSFTWNVSSKHDITFQDCLNMMIIDAVYLSFLSWYFDKVWPSEYGTQEVWYFLFTPQYWNTLDVSAAKEDINVELISEDLMTQYESKTCIDIRNLRKTFDTPQGTKVAIDGLSLSMFQGQITALLGHNGAGKTTTIAVLTGLISSDSGSAVIEGKNVSEDMDEIRTNLGVCPQHDILFPDLTVEEHLSMFASFKGVSNENLEKEINDRKLSVGIAFIGGSRHREGRIIVLTTHFMDEADLLGDRIAIMEKKSSIGFDEKPVSDLIKKHVDSASMITDVGTELSFQLPFSASSLFPKLFSEIEASMDNLGLESYGISVTTLEEVFIKITRNTHTNQTAQKGLDNQTEKLSLSKEDEDKNFDYFIQHVIALQKKRFFYFVRDLKAQIFVYIIPFIFLLGGLLIMANTYPSTYQPSKEINVNMYNSKIQTDILPTPYANPPKWANTVINSIRDSTNFPIRDIGNRDPTTPAAMTAYLKTNKDDYQASQIGSFIMTDATLRSISPASSLKTNYYPLPDTKRQDDLFSNYNADLVVTFMLLSIPFVPAAWITYLVREKQVKSKHQQMVSGVGVVAYWVSNFLWDNLNTTSLGGGGSDYSAEMGCFFGMMFLFGTSMTGFTYLFSFIFKIPSTAQIVMIFVCFITGLVLSIQGGVKYDYFDSWHTDLPEVDQSLKDSDQYFMGLGVPGKYAVRGLSLGIPNGECFGLLGINGAGKSSTLSMLSGEFAPSAGSAYLNGMDLTTDIHTCRRKVEHLQLYARIKGIKEEYIPQVVQAKIEEMGLTEYADRYAGTYSGGNKHEPSTGMDPVAKREKCSLILTTHSMEECEALCGRIGIMVGGVLRCLGSAQRLRSKYGNGYQLEIGMTLPTAAEIEGTCSFILNELKVEAATRAIECDNQISLDDTKKIFMSSQCSPEWHLASWIILERQFDLITKFLADKFDHFIIRELFDAIEKKKGELSIHEYSISQTSLEQIFNYFASQQEEEVLISGSKQTKAKAAGSEVEMTDQ